jgi:hypothetical protein
MKHLLNNLSEEEKNKIREQHGIKIDTDKFKTLLSEGLGVALDNPLWKELKKIVPSYESYVVEYIPNKKLVIGYSDSGLVPDQPNKGAPVWTIIKH